MAASGSLTAELSMDAAKPAPAFAAPAGERDRILARLRERIVAFAASRISRDAAEDLAQEVMLVVHEKYAHVQSLDELLPLCLRILRFKMAAQFRKAHRHGEHNQVAADEIPLAGAGPDPEELAERKEMRERVVAAVRKLDTRSKELLRLKLEGRSFPEIQALLGAKSINTIYTWDFRCRKRLLELLGGIWGKKP